MSEQNNAKPMKNDVGKLRLNTPTNCRKSLTKILRLYSQGRLDDSIYKSLVWGISQLIANFKVELDFSTSKRMAQLEELFAKAEKRYLQMQGKLIDDNTSIDR